MSVSPDSLIGRTLDGRYRIESIAARGGMATVYLASDLRLRRVVAVKVMHASLADDPNFVARCQREARAAAALTHPNVVSVHDQGRDSATGSVYLVMPLVEGYTIRDVLTERGMLTPTQALAVMDPVLQALSAAHAAGFIHRDIKPENIMIADDGVIKVTDFGLARAIEDGESTQTTKSVLIGTVAYLSPEQVEKGLTDARSDVYSAGVLLFEMITGKVPHGGDTPIAIAFQHVHSDIPAPSLVNPALPAVFDRLIRRATQRNADLRYQSAEDFLEDIRHARGVLDGTKQDKVESHSVETLPTTIIEKPDQLPSTAIPSSVEEVINRDTRVTAREVPEVRRERVTGRRASESRATQHDFLDDSQREFGRNSRSSRPPKRRGKLALLLMIPVLAAAWFGYQSARTEVPVVIGKDKVAALKLLEAAGLSANAEATQYSESFAEDEVMSVEPIERSSVFKGSTVTLVISRGPERFAVPSLTNSSVEEAQQALEAANLTAGPTKERFDAVVAKGAVIATEPAAGTRLLKGKEVTLFVSRGPKPVKVPSVGGLTIEAATKKLREAGFTAPISQLKQYSSKLAKGLVLGLTPRSGTKQLQSVALTLTVSDGPPPVVVPNVVNKSKKDAFSLLEKAGLKPSVGSANTCQKGARSSVVETQSVAGGKSIAKGSTVELGIFFFCK